MLLMISENIARNMKSSQWIIFYPTQLHLFGYLRKLNQTFLAHMNAFLCCRIYSSFKFPDFKINHSYLRNVPLPLPGGESPKTLRTSNSAIGLNKDSEAATNPSATTGLYCTVTSLLDPTLLLEKTPCRKELRQR
jgi:hypothetical protein